MSAIKVMQCRRCGCAMGMLFGFTGLSHVTTGDVYHCPNLCEQKLPTAEERVARRNLPDQYPRLIKMLETLKELTKDFPKVIKQLNIALDQFYKYNSKRFQLFKGELEIRDKMNIIRIFSYAEIITGRNWRKHNRIRKRLRHL